MKPPFRRLLPLLLLLLAALPSLASRGDAPPAAQGQGGASGLDPRVEAAIARARAHLGEEQALDAVVSIRIEGPLAYSDGTAGTAEIIYQKPLRHKFVAEIGDFREISALYGTEAWQRVEKIGDDSLASMGFYNADDIRHLQASVREALGFFKPSATPEGRVSYQGAAEVRGRLAVVLRYDHGRGIWYDRHFDRETGRLLLTETDRSISIVEEGSQRVGGIRFPEKLVTRVGQGETAQSIELVYESVSLNETFPDEIFAVPSLVE